VRRGTSLAIVATVIAALTLAAETASRLAAEPRAPAAPGTQAPRVGQIPPKSEVASQPGLPSVEQVLYLIRSTLLTLNDANRSGNYSVLRDLAAPDFQARNTAADLAQIFTDLRRRNFDLFAVALMAPQLTAAPAIDPERCCGSPGCSRPGRDKSTSISRFRSWPRNGGCSASRSRRPNHRRWPRRIRPPTRPLRSQPQSGKITEAE
jgi:hypothetical protein